MRAAIRFSRSCVKHRAKRFGIVGRGFMLTSIRPGPTGGGSKRPSFRFGTCHENQILFSVATFAFHRKLVSPCFAGRDYV
ncbi:MAG: hypothetical protein CMJ81_23060 [Planctomycetaceae bacterium]|nr:hypothetical protein [Planctomycetaceae bacterium]